MTRVNGGRDSCLAGLLNIGPPRVIGPHMWSDVPQERRVKVVVRAELGNHLVAELKGWAADAVEIRVLPERGEGETFLASSPSLVLLKQRSRMRSQ